MARILGITYVDIMNKILDNLGEYRIQNVKFCPETGHVWVKPRGANSRIYLISACDESLIKTALHVLPSWYPVFDGTNKFIGFQAGDSGFLPPKERV